MAKSLRFKNFDNALRRIVDYEFESEYPLKASETRDYVKPRVTVKEPEEKDAI